MQNEGQWTGQKADTYDALLAEAATVFESPGFQRSDVLSRLLKYLVKMTAEGRTVKAFEIAVDGLGRDESESLKSDIHARVVVARLRKALDSYYATANRETELYINPGSYVVRLRQRTNASSPTDSQSKDRLGQSAWRPWGFVAVVLLTAMIVSMLLVWFLPSRSNNGVWVNPNFPNVSVAWANAPMTPEAQECRDEMITALGGYTGIRLVEAGTPADFDIRLSRAMVDGKTGFLVKLTDVRAKRFLWSRPAPDVENCLDEVEMQLTAYSIASPGGVIESFSRRRGVEVDSPYGCWLQFTQGIKIFNTIGNPRLEQCAKDWYSFNPDHPVAAFLYSWTLIDKAAVAPLSTTRASNLRRALSIASKASLLNAEFASLYIAKMRAHSLMSNRAASAVDARQALEHSQHNPLIIGMAASGLALWGDPEGERILLSQAKDLGRQMPWENAALFVVAMMRDDPKAAGEQITFLADIDSGQPVLRILQAAYLARIGKRAAADTVLESLESDPRIWIAGKDRLISRLPMAPEAKRQLRQWLAVGAS